MSTQATTPATLRVCKHCGMNEREVWIDTYENGGIGCAHELTPPAPVSSPVYFTEDERQAVMEVYDRALDDRNDYLTNGHPFADFGDEWPETAREQARRWRVAGVACLKLGGIAMSEACRALVDALEASASEYEAEHGSTEAETEPADEPLVDYDLAVKDGEGQQEDQRP